MQGGHFIPKGSKGESGVRFDERNVHAQCPDCNAFNQGRTLEYLDYMLAEYGQEVIDELRRDDIALKHQRGTVELMSFRLLYKDLARMPENNTIITFQQDTKERKRFFKAASFAHPAKMHLSLQIYLIEHYTKPGDTILDPMAGSGTILIACTLGRNVICVELEEKFVEMMKGFDCDGKIKGYKDVWVEPIKEGWIVDVDDGYYYSEPFETKKQAEEWIKKDMYDIFGGKHVVAQTEIDFQKGVDGYWTKEVIPAKCGKKKNHKPHFIEGNWQKIKSLGPMLGYQFGQATILQGDARNLNGMLADNILFSPPYAETLQKGKSLKERTDGMADMLRKERPYSYDKTGADSANKGCGDNQNNISYLPYGEISAVINSPPFGEAHNLKGLGVGDNDRKDLRDYSYLKTETKGQIGNLPYPKANAIITSPPYEDKTTFQDYDFMNKTAKDQKDRREKGLIKGHSFSVEARQRAMNKAAAGAIQNQENIGNLKSENYLQAMLQVYRQCHRVLKEKGLMVLVVKNFIRDKKIVRLDLDTIKLCEQAGFILKERLYRKLTQQSFWRTIYHNKFPDVEKIEYEDVLILQRSTS